MHWKTLDFFVNIIYNMSNGGKLRHFIMRGSDLMWTRALLKKNAWENLKGYYWPALGVCVLANILGANGGGGGFGSGGGGSSYSESSGSSSAFDDVDPSFLIGIIIFILVCALIGMAIGIAYVCFLGMPVRCGQCKYFVTARNGDQNFGHLFDNFKGGNYMPTVKAMFSYYIEIFLWSLLFIIPGVIKTYEYALVPYLIAENPRLDIKRAKEISRQTMDGEKMNYWILQLSFIGWYMLGVFVCCIGTVFVQPYEQATYAEFYMCMRAKMLSYGYTSEDELTGGFGNGMGGGMSSYNEPNFNNNAYNVQNPSNPYDSAQNTGYPNTGYQNPNTGYQNPNTGYQNPNAGYQNPNDQYNGNMPGVDLDKHLDDQNNDFNNPYNN